MSWFILSNEIGTILGVYGSALETEARERGRYIADSTQCRVALHHILLLNERPHVGDSISMNGPHEWL